MAHAEGVKLGSSGEDRLAVVSPAPAMETQAASEAGASGEGFTRVRRRKKRVGEPREGPMETGGGPPPKKRPDFPPLRGDALGVSPSLGLTQLLCCRKELEGRLFQRCIPNWLATLLLQQGSAVEIWTTWGLFPFTGSSITSCFFKDLLRALGS